MQLRWHDYKYYPYERHLARRELLAVLGLDDCDMTELGVRLPPDVDVEAVRRLTYFSHVSKGAKSKPTTQSVLETAASAGRARQSTRYSVHGLHEYKGKFNPQIAKSILNIFGVRPGSRVLDPFCGSGTTLAETAHLHAEGVGTDINPLAVYLANAKLACLRTPIDDLRSDFLKLSSGLKKIRKATASAQSTPRQIYLRSWFSDPELVWIETVKRLVNETCRSPEVFLAIASNLLRDYSDQDPDDLRIRRRSSPLPTSSFRDAFLIASAHFLERIASVQTVLGVGRTPSRAFLSDVREIDAELGGKFDAAITSPPYATALPYIDTQRLSLVWLDLCDPTSLGALDSSLIGSREMKKRERKQLVADLHDNAAGLPDEQARFCRKLAVSVGPDDGFRRIAVPGLIYRYLTDMHDSFHSVGRHVKSGGRYALIVGHNHTVLSGVRRDIDTPSHLAALAEDAGWKLDEAIALQTYPRYGLHAGNAVGAETLLILSNTR